MEVITHWAGNIVSYLVFLTVLTGLLPAHKYEKYIRLFAGCILLLIVLKPLTDGLRLEERLNYLFTSLSFENEAGELKREMDEIEVRRRNMVLSQYEAEASKEAVRVAAEAGFSVEKADVELEKDPESEQFASVRSVTVYVAGSEAAFVQRMNERAQELGMVNTHFVNCTGLPADGHVTSAYDIALMSRELIWRHPDIRRFTTIWMDSLRDGASMLVNTNKLVRFYPGATGLKTGSTDSAKYCISATAEKDGMELIAVILGGSTSDKRFSDAKALLNYGFAAYSLVTVTPESPLPAVPVTLGTQKTVQSVLTSENALLLEKSRANGLTQAVSLPESIDAPVEEGEPLGTLDIFDADGTPVASLPLLAGESIPHLTWSELFCRLLKLAYCGA